jgi:hypothetical protein
MQPFALCFFYGSRQDDHVLVHPSLFSRNNYHISLPCRPTTPSPLWACCAYPGSLDPVPQDERIPAHDRGVSHVLSCPIRVKCMHETPAVARPPGMKLCSGRVLPGCRQTSPCCYIIFPLPFRTFLSFFLKSAPGSNHRQFINFDNDNHAELQKSDVKS